ncbi:MAG: GFA family protein [Myxococcales bacterium]|nr:GFA family protein [Myxococcales bacterium]
MTKTHHGSCHCGAVRYEADLDLGGKATRCNCSVCTKIGSTNTNLKPAAFRLLTEERALATYSMSPNGTRYFCPKCGVHCFGRGDVPELGGAFVSINVATLDDVDVGQLEIGHWDGRHDNWQAGLRDRPWPIA